MAYLIDFTAYRGSDWAAAIEAINAETNRPYDLTGATIELTARGRGSRVLRASTEDGTIQLPQPHVLRWRFEPSQMGGLYPGMTYAVGCRVTTEGGSFTLFTGNLAYLDGEVHP